MDRILRTQLEKIRKFLYSQKCKSFLVFLFFLFVSASFWMLQTLNETLEVNVRLPLQLLNVPKTAVLTRELPEAVDVRLSDKGSVLVQYLYRKKLQPLMLDFANYDKGNVSGRVVIPHNDVIRLLQPQLIESSKVQSINPDTIDYYYTRGLPSRLPVKVKGIVKTTAQNYLSALHCYPDSVEVYAPASVMDTMKCAYTSEVVWEGLTETVTREVGLYPIKGVKYMTPKVKVK
ncbi:MAG: YbbR-like domain-containing protein, partial [Bacteroidaceae bacterium]|nr:YbbR-like domain-containing protein [Bacteroidaceae bacterium]